MSEEEQFQLSNTYWICKKLIDNGDEKVRDPCQVTGKFRGAAHWGCNIVIDSMQFMTSSLDKLVKNLSDSDFKYLSEEFS